MVRITAKNIGSCSAEIIYWNSCQNCVYLFTGVPSQPSNLRAPDTGETTVTLQWTKPTHSGETIVSYELYWNDTYAKEKHHRRIPISESYTLTGLYPNTLYYVWLAARSQRGEGATTPPIPVRTKQYGKTTHRVLHVTRSFSFSISY